MTYGTTVEVVACKVSSMQHEWKWLHKKYEVWNMSELGYMYSMKYET